MKTQENSMEQIYHASLQDINNISMEADASSLIRSKANIIGQNIHQYRKKVDIKALMYQTRKMLNKNATNLMADSPNVNKKDTDEFKQKSISIQIKQKQRKQQLELSKDNSTKGQLLLQQVIAPLRVYPRDKQDALNQTIPFGQQKIYESSHNNIYGTMRLASQTQVVSNQVSSRSRQKHQSLQYKTEQSSHFKSQKNSVDARNSIVIETDKNNYMNIDHNNTQVNVLQNTFESPYIQAAQTTHARKSISPTKMKEYINKVGAIRRQPRQFQNVDLQSSFERKKSLLHASREASQKALVTSQQAHQEDEKQLKVIRLSIEKIKNLTIDKLESMNLRSPSEWRDNLINYRIRRKIINRETSIEEFDKEKVYNQQPDVPINSILSKQISNRAQKANESITILENQTQRLKHWNQLRKNSFERFHSESSRDQASHKTIKNRTVSDFSPLHYPSTQYTDHQTAAFGSSSRTVTSQSKVSQSKRLRRTLFPSGFDQQSRNQNSQSFFENRNTNFKLQYSIPAINGGMAETNKSFTALSNENGPQQMLYQTLMSTGSKQSIAEDEANQSASTMNKPYVTKFPWSPYCNTCQVRNVNLLQNRNFEKIRDKGTGQSRLIILKL